MNKNIIHVTNNPLIQKQLGSTGKLAVCTLSLRNKWPKSSFHHFHFVCSTKFCITVGSISPEYHSSLMEKLKIVKTMLTRTQYLGKGGGAWLIYVGNLNSKMSGFQSFCDPQILRILSGMIADCCKNINLAASVIRKCSCLDLSLTSVPGNWGYLTIQVSIRCQNLGQPRNNKIPNCREFSPHMKTKFYGQLQKYGCSILSAALQKTVITWFWVFTSASRSKFPSRNENQTWRQFNKTFTVYLHVCTLF